MRRGKSTTTPTKAEAAWMAAIADFGCVVCFNQGIRHVPAAVHHILGGGIRKGHFFTLPLCDPGHHQNAPRGVVCRHPNKAEFERQYGTEMNLLDQLIFILQPADHPATLPANNKIAPRPASVHSVTHTLEQTGP